MVHEGGAMRKTGLNSKGNQENPLSHNHQARHTEHQWKPRYLPRGMGGLGIKLVRTCRYQEVKL